MMRNKVTHPSCIHNPVSAIYLTNYTYAMLNNEEQRLPNSNLKQRWIHRIAWQGKFVLLRYKQFSQAAPERTRFRAKRGERQYSESRPCIVDCFYSFFAKGHLQVLHHWYREAWFLKKSRISCEKFPVGRGSSSKHAECIGLQCSKISISHPASTTWQYNICILWRD